VARLALLLPRSLDGFLQADHVRELLRTEDAVAIEPGRLPYGAILRAPPMLRPLLGRLLAARVRRKAGGKVDVVVAYHAVQWPVVGQLLASGRAQRAWYMRWDRYEAALDAGNRAELLADWHERLADASSLTFTVSERLAELERECGRQAICVGQPADSFPSEPLHASLPGQPLDDGSLVAVSLGHLGRRTDWGLLRRVLELAPELVLADPLVVEQRAQLGDHELVHLLAQVLEDRVPLTRRSLLELLPTRVLGRHRKASWPVTVIRDGR